MSNKLKKTEEALEVAQAQITVLLNALNEAVDVLSADYGETDEIVQSIREAIDSVEE